MKWLLCCGSLACGILCYLLACWWYIGAAFAVLAVLLGFTHNRRFGRSRITLAGIICGTVYLGIAVLFGLSMLFYYANVIWR